MLIKKIDGVARRSRLASTLTQSSSSAVDRRGFLKASGLVAGGIAAAATMNFGMVKKAEAQAQKPSGNVKTVKSVCTHCAVGCTVMAEVQGGVWIGRPHRVEGSSPRSAGPA